MNKTGLLQCADYALPPNYLHFCGPEKQVDLAEYKSVQIADAGLNNILVEFETLYPYLILIAHENNIKDPFDPRVVEAYWLGNSLLSKVTLNKYHIHLSETLHLKQKLKKKDLNVIMGKLDKNMLPHHTHHVLNIFTRTGHTASPHTIETMDNCRIGWGKVVTASLLSGAGHNTLTVETAPLVIESGKLTLGNKVNKIISQPVKTSNINGYPARGYVSFHWNMFCGFLTARQVANLTFYTNKAIQLANLTLQ